MPALPGTLRVLLLSFIRPQIVNIAILLNFCEHLRAKAIADVVPSTLGHLPFTALHELCLSRDGVTKPLDGFGRLQASRQEQPVFNHSCKAGVTLVTTEGLSYTTRSVGARSELYALLNRLFCAFDVLATASGPPVDAHADCTQDQKDETQGKAYE